KDELLKLWKNLVSNFVEFILTKNTEEKMSMRISKDDSIDVEFDEYFFAYTDHSTYHRGQLIDHYKFATGNEKAISSDHYDYLVEKYSKK
ncbi:MAG: hypothetical protein ACC656_11635, partial [Candidatus Heimdallarchaeota archaeon]